jgi:hypothetical protein
MRLTASGDGERGVAMTGTCAELRGNPKARRISLDL